MSSAIERTPPSWRGEYLSLCRRLRSAREAAGLSQDKVSARIGVGLRTLVRWEAGETSPDAMQLFRWADVVGLSLTSAPKVAHLQAA